MVGSAPDEAEGVGVRNLTTLSKAYRMESMCARGIWPGKTCFIKWSSGSRLVKQCICLT